MGNKPVLAVIAGGGCPQIENAIGIIKAIQTVRYEKFDYMWGTSAGAVVSSILMSMDQDVTKFEETIRNTPLSTWIRIKPLQLLKSIIGFSNYFVDDTGLKEFLLEHLTPEAEKRVKVTVTEMGKYGSDPIVGESLLLPGTPRATLASMSFQHIFPPVVWDGTMYGDGGVLNLCPLPKYLDFPKYEHIYVILAATAPLFPTIKRWKFLNQVFNVIDRSMDREVSQIHELGLNEAENITVLQPDKWTETASFLNWSNNFEQIDASYQYALRELEKKG